MDKFKLRFREEEKIQIDDIKASKCDDRIIALYNSKDNLLCWSYDLKMLKRFMRERSLSKSDVYIVIEDVNSLYSIIHEDFELIEEEGYLIRIMESYIVDNERANQFHRVLDVTNLLKKSIANYHFKKGEKEVLIEALQILCKYKKSYKNTESKKFNKFIRLKEFVGYIVGKNINL